MDETRHSPPIKLTLPEGHFGMAKYNIMALLHNFFYKFRGNNTYIIQEKSALQSSHFSTRFKKDMKHVL